MTLSIVKWGDNAQAAIALASILLFLAAKYGGTELAVIATLTGLACAGLFKVVRGPSFFDKRLDWDNFYASHNDKPNFKVHIRMGSQSFMKLLSYVRQNLQRNERMGSLCGGPLPQRFGYTSLFGGLLVPPTLISSIKLVYQRLLCTALSGKQFVQSTNVIGYL